VQRTGGGVYLDSLSNGDVLSTLNISPFLVNQKRIQQLVVLCLGPLHLLPTCPPLVMSIHHTTAVFTAQTLLTLCTSEREALSKMGNMQLGTGL
jgi:hypothetical protein